VQHYPFVDITKVSPCWDVGQRDAFLEVLAPYNVIALLTGHVHYEKAFNQAVAVPGTQKSFREFRPGSAGAYSRFAVLRVTPTTFDIQFGDTSSGSVAWMEGQGFAVDSFDGWTQLPGTKSFSHAPAVLVRPGEPAR
jgi:hypothetical protein